MKVLEPTVLCPLNPYGAECRVPLESCTQCPNYCGLNNHYQVMCTVGSKNRKVGD